MKGSGSEREYEYVIVGGGPSGIYFYDQLLEKNVSGNVILFEKSAYKEGTVGRLQSDSNDALNTKTKDELGGMRMYPSKMPKVANLAKRAGCDLIHVDTDDSHNYFYYKGNRYNKKKFKTEYKFSSGRTMHEAEKIVFDAFEKQHPGESKKSMYSKFLCSMTVKEFYLKFGATEEEAVAVNAYSGYDLDCDSAAVMFIEEQFLGSDLAWDHHFVVQGYGAIFQRLAKDRMKIEYDSPVRGIQKTANGYRIIVDTPSGIKVVTAKNVVLALSHMGLTSVLDASPNLIEEKREHVARNSVKSIPFFKCFLEWDHAWWEDINFKCGKSTTDMQIRQLHYYDTEDLLIYNSGENATYWGEKCLKDPQAAAREIFKQVQKIHYDVEIPEPKFKEFIWHLHPNEHLWNPPHLIDESMKTIVLPTSKDNKVFIVGDAYSHLHGWVCGAVQTVDLCFDTNAVEQQKLQGNKEEEKVGWRKIPKWAVGLGAALVVGSVGYILYKKTSKKD